MHVTDNIIGLNFFNNSAYEDILNRLPIAIAITTYNGTVRFLNNTGLELLEVKKDDTHEFSLLEKKYWKDCKAVENAITKAINNGTWEGILVTKKELNLHFKLNSFKHKEDTFIQVSIQKLNSQENELSQHNQKNHIKEMRALFESVPDGVAISDINNPTRFLYVNQNFCKLTGYKKEEIVLKPATVQQLYGTVPSDIKLSKRLDETFQFKKRLLHDVPLQHSDTKLIYCDLYSSFVEINSRKYLVSYFQDISDRREAINRLTEFDNEIVLTQDLTRSGTWKWNIKDGSIEWSDGFYKLIGKDSSTKKPANKVFFDCIVESDRNRVLEILDESINQCLPFEVFFKIYKGNYATHTVKLNGNIAEDQEGNASILTAILQDSSEITEVEEELNKSERVRKKSESISKTAYWEMDITSNHITWSEQIFTLCDLDKNQQNLTREEYNGLVHPRDRDKLFNSIKNAKNNGIGFTEEYRIILHDDSLKYFQEKVEVVKDAKDNPILINGTIQDITEHKSVENELKYQQYLLQNVNDAIISTNIRLEIKSWNKAATEIYGWTAENVIGKKLKEVLEPQDTEQISMEDVLQQVMKTGFWKGNLRQKTKHGKEVIVQSSSRLLRDENGFPLGIATVNRDITAFTKIEEQAVEYQRMLELMFDSIPGWIFWEDKDFIIQGCNKHFAQAMGKSSNSDLIGNKLEDFIKDASFINNARRVTKQIFENQSTHYHIVESLSRDKQQIWLDVNRLPLLNQKGDIVGVMCTMEDITEKKDIEAQLKENQATLASVIENTDDLIWYLDKKHKFQAFNTAAVRKVKELVNADIKVGDDFFSILPPLYRKMFRDFHDEVLEGNKLTREERFDPRIGLPSWFEFSGNPIFNGDETHGACYIVRDITLRKQQEQLILENKLGKERELSLAVIHGQEEERKRISMELHDGVCQTLTALQMQANYLEDVKDNSNNLESQLSPLVRIIQLADHAEMEVRRISSNLMPSVLTDFGLPEAVNHLCNLIFQESNVAFDIDILLNGKRFPNTVEIGIFRIIQEVLNNIYKHSSATQVGITLLDEGSRIFISIKDNGKGFSQEEMKEKRKHRNGLNNLAQRVSLLGGIIEIESVPGNGSEIIAYIPYTGEPINY